MDRAIIVENLVKNFEVNQKGKGLSGTISSLVKPKKKLVKALKGISFSIKSGELVGFIGPNGAGKSTLVKILMGLEKENEGTSRLGDNVSVGYFSQMQAGLDSDKEILQEFIDKTGVFFGEAYGYLSRFLFDRKSVKKKIWQFRL